MALLLAALACEADAEPPAPRCGCDFDPSQEPEELGCPESGACEAATGACVPATDDPLLDCSGVPSSNDNPESVRCMLRAWRDRVPGSYAVWLGYGIGTESRRAWILESGEAVTRRCTRYDYGGGCDPFRLTELDAAAAQTCLDVVDELEQFQCLVNLFASPAPALTCAGS